MNRLTALILTMAVFPALAGELATMSDGDIEFAIDTAVFGIGSGETMLLEVYQEVGIAQFSRDESGNSVFTTEITLASPAGDTLAWDIWNTPVTWSEAGTAVNCSLLPVLPGNWTLTVTMNDLENGRLGTATRELRVSETGHFSDIELARTIMPAAEGSLNSLLKGNMIVYPAASTRFGVPGESMFYTYQEIYLQGGSDMLRHSRLLDASGVPVFARPAQRVSIPEGVDIVALVDSFDLSVVRESGLYSLSVVYTRDTDTVSVKSKPMFIEVAETVLFEQVETLAAPVRLQDQFKILLNREESELYSRLDSTSQAFYYDNYWNARPGEHEVFAQSCRIADARYSSFGRSGWESDRGRVFIIFGEPEDVEVEPFSTTEAPYEIWHYYGNQQESFVFADLIGNGDYLQIYSTIEGEVSYSDWQGMLQNVNQGTGSDEDDMEF